MERSTVAQDTTPAAVDAATLGEALRRTAAEHPHVVAVRTLDDGVSLTWSEVRERVDALARGLAGLGVGRGDTVALMMGNRPEFHLCDLAAVTLGATPFSIYQTFTAEQIAYVIGDAGARVAIVEQAHLAVLLEAKRDLPASSTSSSWTGPRTRRPARSRSPRSRARTPASTSTPRSLPSQPTTSRR